MAMIAPPTNGFDYPNGYDWATGNLAWDTITTSTTVGYPFVSGSSSANTYVVLGNQWNQTAPTAPKRKKKAARPEPESNIAWLDRRVQEMRVAL